MAESTSTPRLSKASDLPACWSLSRTGKYVSGRLHRTVRRSGVRAACVPEEVHARSSHSQGRYRPDPWPSQSCGADREGDDTMKKQRVVRGIPVEEGSGNVYRDLGYR